MNLDVRLNLVREHSTEWIRDRNGALGSKTDKISLVQ